MWYSFNTHMGLPTFCHLFYATLGFMQHWGLEAGLMNRHRQKIFTLYNGGQGVHLG
jgi:hypothetical protein